MKTLWEVGYNETTATVRLYRVPAHVSLLLALEDCFGVVDGLTGHFLCGSSVPEFFWKIPLGRPSYDHEWLDEEGKPTLDNSLGGFMWGASSAFMGYTYNVLSKYLVTTYELPIEEARRQLPSFYFRDYDEIYGDEE